MRPAEPTDGSITRRRELRREIRAWLGTSSDDPPSLEHLLHAARRMAAMIDLTSGGRYGLAVQDFLADEAKPIEDIQARERGYRQLEDERLADLRPHTERPKPALPDPLGGGDPYHDADRR